MFIVVATIIVFMVIWDHDCGTILNLPQKQNSKYAPELLHIAVGLVIFCHPSLTVYNILGMRTWFCLPWRLEISLTSLLFTLLPLLPVQLQDNNRIGGSELQLLSSHKKEIKDMIFVYFVELLS